MYNYTYKLRYNYVGNCNYKQWATCVITRRKCNHTYNYRLVGMPICTIMLILIARWNYSVIIVEPIAIIL